MHIVIKKSRESKTKGNLAILRSTLSIYYADNDVYPIDDLASIVPKYIEEIPECHAPFHHSKTRIVNNNTTMGWAGLFTADEGTWGYGSDVKDPGGSNSVYHGVVWVACTHIDTSNKIWSEY